MNQKKNILIIIGSAGNHSANQKLVEWLASSTSNALNITIYNKLKSLPHFDPELSIENTPAEIIHLRESIEKSDAVLICTPEYVFSIPSGLKNALEWCVSTTVFSDKPIGIITASADGRKGHEELKMIMKTIVAKFTEETTLLIQGIKGKVDADGNISDHKTREDLEKFTSAFIKLVSEIL